jgi:hypothetical protein
MTKIAGFGSESGSITQRYGSADPDPDPHSPQNVMDPQHWLKVPKREIFDRSDFPDFYTIKSLRVCVFRVKIKNLF